MKKNLRSSLLMAGFLGLAASASAQTAGFVKWPLTANTSDNVTLRSANVTPGTPALRRLVVSNNQLPTGTGNQAFAPFSSAGQALAPVADGGGWSTTVSTTYPLPGTGGSPRRRFFEQFSVAATGAAVRFDSVVFNANVFNSAAGKVAVAWSLTNFVSDSASVTGGKGPVINNSTNVRTGGVLAATENGSFGVSASGNPGEIANNSAILPQTTGTITTLPDLYGFALAGATGVTVPAGQTLTVRIYPAVGSSSGGRYFLLRNVTLKSRQTPLATRSGVETNLAAYPNPVQNRLMVPHLAASREARVTVFSTTGAKVAAFTAQPGTTETSVDLGALDKGLYLVEYADGSKRSSARIIKE